MTERTHYYVSAIDGPRHYLLAGPYPTKDAAKAQVDAALKVANEQDPRAWFMSWGTSGSDTFIKTPLGEGWKP